MLQRLLQVKTELPAILFEQGIDNLSQDVWQLLETIHSFLKPFAVYTDLLAQETATTLSTVLPYLLSLQNHVKETLKRQNLPMSVRNAAQLLEIDFKKRFSSVLDVNSASFQPAYALSTFLDSRYRVILESSLKTAAISELKQILSLGQASSLQTASPDLQLQQPLSELVDDDSHDYLDHLLKTASTQSTSPPSSSPIDEEIERCQKLPRLDRKADADPLQQWISLPDSDCPLVRPLALDILSIPASSGSVERLFSAAGKAKSGDRSKLGADALENEILIRCNSKIIDLLVH